jgi:hypothetical protein
MAFIAWIGYFLYKRNIFLKIVFQDSLLVKISKLLL